MSKFNFSTLLTNVNLEYIMVNVLQNNRIKKNYTFKLNTFSQVPCRIFSNSASVKSNLLR